MGSIYHRMIENPLAIRREAMGDMSEGGPDAPLGSP